MLNSGENGSDQDNGDLGNNQGAQDPGRGQQEQNSDGGVRRRGGRSNSNQDGGGSGNNQGAQDPGRGQQEQDSDGGGHREDAGNGEAGRWNPRNFIVVTCTLLGNFCFREADTRIRQQNQRGRGSGTDKDGGTPTPELIAPEVFVLLAGFLWFFAIFVAISGGLGNGRDGNENLGNIGELEEASVTGMEERQQNRG
ncbi:hypothetical protein [Neorickettsia findlayensis]|uniref:Uncharacterized protein n=1 Tax=Neorickettsia findlayensis TaxID=2686014 RepID=A0A6P1GBZ5_9RICK|nr:hypothetical protein [Neorickettsia findlayensis]QHD65331.1 hypothetical protein GP480_02645 [Neorickettsia findlayensis]